VLGNLKMRRLSSSFINDLKHGILSPILDDVLSDNNLDLEIRNEYVNIYYGGGNLLRIRQMKKAYRYNFFFDIRYVDIGSPMLTKIKELPEKIHSESDVSVWNEMIPYIKKEMDRNFIKHSKPEREFQQLVVRENNTGNTSKATDYSIFDIEYQRGNTRFDLVGGRKLKNDKFRLAIIEMKYLDGALKGKAGLIEHVEKAKYFFDNNDINEFKKELIVIAKQKQELDLISNLPEKIEFSTIIPEFIFLIANHKPASSVLQAELDKLVSEDFYKDFSKICELKISSANFMGYGLFSNCVYNMSEFNSINDNLVKLLIERKK